MLTLTRKKHLQFTIHKNKFVKQKNIENLNITTPIQLISSGMQINYLGLGIPHDDTHNWALLSLNEDSAQIKFFNKNGANACST